MDVKGITQKVKMKLGLFHEIIDLKHRSINAGGVYRVIQIGNKKPYVAISASRKEFSAKENSDRSSKLLGNIKSLGLYAYQLVGYYKECPEDKPNCEDKDKTLVEEESFFVPYSEKVSLETFLESLHNLGKEFNQDSILVGLPEGYSYKKESINVSGTEIKTGAHYYLYSNGSIENQGTKLKPSAIVNYGSRAIDPKKKDRKIDWKVVGTVQPMTVMGMQAYSSSGLLFLSGARYPNCTCYDSIEDYLKRTPNSIKFINKI